MFYQDAYYLLFSLLLIGIWHLSHYFTEKPLLMHTSDLHFAKSYIQCFVLFYLTCQKISPKLTSCFIHSLPLAFITAMVPPVSLLLSLSSWLVSLSVDIISILGHRFLTLVSFRFSMHCILDLNQCPKFMST